MEHATDPLGGLDSATAAGWSAAAAAVLRKVGRMPADADDSAAWDLLARRTVEDLPIPPLGTPQRSADLHPPGDPGRPPYTRGSSAPSTCGWDVRPLLTDPDPRAANAAALADLESGATSLWITLGTPGTAQGDLAAVLDGVYLDLAPVVLRAAGEVDDLQAARAFADVLTTRSMRATAGSNLGADPIGAAIRFGADPGDSLSEVAEIATLASALEIGALVVDATVAHQSGAGDAAEIGYALAVGAHYLRMLTAAGYDVDTACTLMEFRFSVTNQQFVSIAKLRAARMTWYRVAELSGASSARRAQRQHAVTSRPMLTRYDPWVNLLRTTVAAFAAGIGGAAAITVLPFDAAIGVPDEFSRRLARNISALLIQESHVAAVADPAGGAHAVELLTAGLAEAAWAEFGAIERSGGIAAALADGSWAARAKVAVGERNRRIATRAMPITGVSEFPDPMEVLPARRSWPVPADPGWAAPFEALRDAPAPTPVLLVGVGSPAAHATRMLFCRNLLGAGGIRIAEVPEGDHTKGPGVSGEKASISAAASSTPDGVAVALRAAGTSVALLAGRDQDYATQGPALIAALRAAGASTVLLAGRPAPDLAELLDGHVTAGQDVLAFLHQVRGSLAVAP